MTHTIRNTVLGALALFAISLAASAAGVDTNAVGLRGYDPVAYFADNEARLGKNGFAAVHNEVVYLFDSEANQNAFKTNPDAYLPQYGGYCAMGVAFGRKIPIDPEAWKIVDGKLYLNVSKQVQKAWSKDIPGNISTADTNWPEIVDIPLDQF